MIVITITISLTVSLKGNLNTYFSIFLFTISWQVVLNLIIKYETTQNKIKICEKLLNSINYGYLIVNLIL